MKLCYKCKIYMTKKVEKHSIPFHEKEEELVYYVCPICKVQEEE